MKVLIVSHNPMSTYNGMGKTIAAFFSEFDETELCQFYIYPSYPDVDICKSYYRVTDKDILRSLLTFQMPGGPVSEEQIGGEPAIYENENDQKIYANKKNKRPARILLRDLMWKCSRWYNRRLKQWLDQEQPDCLFLAPGGAKFIYDIALKIAKERDIPIVTYIADEYYFVSPDKGMLGKFQLRLLKKTMRKALAHSAHVITISREFEDAYRKEFDRQTTTIMTGSVYAIPPQPRVKPTVSRISYFGNIAYNRYVSLAEIGQALDAINRERQTDFGLDVYSGQTDDSAMRLFQSIDSIRWQGFVSGTEFEEKFLSSDALLHTEAFDERNIDLVKHSVSTKIADSLTVGIPLFAYGPDSVSSMKHLIRHECAVTATSKNELKAALETMLTDSQVRARVAENAVRTASEFHDQQTNSAKLRSIFAEIEEGCL